MSVRIIVDSSADMTPAARKRVRAVAMGILFGSEVYEDGVTIGREDFYRMLAQSNVLPTTSQPTPAAFEDLFREAVEVGDRVVCITVSSKLSGTYQSACIAASEFPGKVFVADSLSVAIGTGILAEYALSLADRGLDPEEIHRALMQKREQLRVYAVVDTLEYLKKGGRLRAATAFVGGLLNVKPVVCMADGEIQVLGSARGLKKAFAMVNQECANHGGMDREMPMLLGYTGQSGEQLTKYREESGDLWPEATENAQVGPTVGVHVGPGAVAMAYFSRE